MKWIRCGLRGRGLLLQCVAALLSVAAPPLVPAQVSDRPANVPADYLSTPVGYFHRACVLTVGEDEVVTEGAIVKTDGTARRAFGPCSRPSFDRAGNVRSESSPPPTIDGWLGSSQTYAGPLEWIFANWTVPPPPPVIGSQQVYLFPGLIPGYGSFILQPVLTWNGAEALGNTWAIYSWNCCSIGNSFHSPPQPVNTGETISGYVLGTGCDQQSGVCTTWQVRTSGTYVSSTHNTNTAGQVLPYAIGGALEARPVSSCNQLPAASSYTFSNISVRQVGGATLSPAWVPNVDVTTPQCVSNVGVSSATTTIYRTCESGLTLCSGVCVDLASDRNNCGACGYRCTYGCTQGQCNAEPPSGCPYGTIDCCGDGGCVKPSVCAKLACG